MRYLIFIAFLIASHTAAAGPASAPSTAPSTETLLGGKVTFTPPRGWDLRGKSNDGKTVSYKLDPDMALMGITVTEQEIALNEAAAAKMGQAICKKLRDTIVKSGAEILTPPIAEKDDRFFLRIHVRYTQDGKMADQLQLFRVLGIELVNVAVTAFSDSSDDVKMIFGEAEQILLGVQAPGINHAKPLPANLRAPTTKPVLLTEAKLRITPPAGWRAEVSDNASGIVATFRDPQDETNLIAVSLRQLPQAARTDPKTRDVIVDEMVAAEKQQFKIEGAQVQGSSQTIKDNRFLRKVRTKYEAKGKGFQIESRQLRVGKSVISVTTVSLDEQADLVEKLADEVALSIKSAGR
jgi:hypothetical protein